MTDGRLYVGAVPLSPLQVTVTDAGSPLDLSDYTDVELSLVNPLGQVVDTSAGEILLDEAESGVVKYAWPDTSLFTTPGDYRIQLRLSNGDAQDYTTVTVVEVYRPMEFL